MFYKKKSKKNINKVSCGFDDSKYKVELERAWRILDEIIAVMPGHVYWKNRQCILQGCNDLQAKNSGLSSRDQIIGKTAYDLLFQDQPEEEKRQQAAMINSIDEEVMKNDRSMTIEEDLVMPDKSIAIYLSKKTPLHNEFGHVTGLVGISFDITDRKKSEIALQQAKEQAEAASRAKTEFMENMRHDIRTPLTGIIGFAELIQKEAVSEKVKMYANHLVSATTALLDFQNEILDAIKLASGENPVLKRSLHLKNLIQRVIDLLKPKAIVKNLLLTLKYDPQLPQFIVTDDKRLFRILLELMTNALKFTSAGEVSVTAKYKLGKKNESILLLSVNDTGIGIPKKYQRDIFLRFKRLTPSSDGVYEGSGLGLTIVKQFVEDLNGALSLTSELQVGSTFICSIPFTPSDQIEKTELSAEIIQINASTIDGHAHVLLVEDHPLTAKVTELLLSEIGCDVSVAIDFDSAMTKSHYARYDLILLDLGLPNANGFDIAKSIKQDPNHLNYETPIVVLTAHAEEEYQFHFQHANICAVFQKPLLKSTAIEMVNQYNNASKNKLPSIDLSLGAKRIAKNEHAAKMMLLELIKTLEDDLLPMIAAFQKMDWKSLDHLLHRLIGALLYCGAPRLEATCHALKLAIKNQDQKNSQQRFTDMQKAIEALQHSLIGDSHVV